MIRFSHTIFYVSDVIKAIQFYDLAFDLKPKFIHESKLYAELMTEGVTLAFANEELGEVNLPDGFQRHDLKNKPQACEIAFTAEDPEKYYLRALNNGAKDLSPPQKKPWGQTVAYVRDWNGILIEIATPIA